MTTENPTKTYTDEQQLAYAMLTESTGSALCDSGGAYGRHWERNQKLSIEDFDALPEVRLETRAMDPHYSVAREDDGESILIGGENADDPDSTLIYLAQTSLTRTWSWTKDPTAAYTWTREARYEQFGYSDKRANAEEMWVENPPADHEIEDFSVELFHYLPEILELDDLCKEFNSTFKDMATWDGPTSGISDEAGIWLLGHSFTPHTFRAYTADDWSSAQVNTYNGEDKLSQTLQYTPMKLRNPTPYTYTFDSYVLLQVHNGCDVRGGYTDAKLWKFRECDTIDIDTTPTVYGAIRDADGDSVLQFSNTESYTRLTCDGDNPDAILIIPAGGSATAGLAE